MTECIELRLYVLGLSFQKEVNVIIFYRLYSIHNIRWSAKQFPVPVYFSLVCVAKTAAEQTKLQPPLLDGRRRGQIDGSKAGTPTSLR